MGTKYSIYLVEQAPQQEVRHVPWRTSSVIQAVEVVERSYQAALAPLEIEPPISRHLTARS